MEKLIWTSADQRTLEELQLRRTKFMGVNRQVVRDVARSVPSSIHPKEVETFVDWLIENADAMRDALAPFDSGNRPAAPAPYAGCQTPAPALMPTWVTPAGHKGPDL